MRSQTRSWITNTVAELVASLNYPHPLSLSARDAERLWSAWQSAATDLRRARGEAQEAAAVRPLVCNVLRPLVGGTREWKLALVLTPEGRLRIGAKSPSADGARSAVELLDYARKSGPAWRTVRRLRRCAECRRFFDDQELRAARHENAYCNDKCRKAARRNQRATPDAKAKARERVKRLYDRRSGLDAKPGKARSAELLKRPGQNQRLRILEGTYGLSGSEALVVLEREIARVERKHGV